MSGKRQFFIPTFPPVSQTQASEGTGSTMGVTWEQFYICQYNLSESEKKQSLHCLFHLSVECRLVKSFILMVTGSFLTNFFGMVEFRAGKYLIDHLVQPLPFTEFEEIEAQRRKVTNPRPYRQHLDFKAVFLQWQPASVSLLPNVSLSPGRVNNLHEDL